MTKSRLVLALIFASLLAACGQRGPLYLPEDPSAPAASQAAPAAPADATEDDAEDVLEEELEDEDKVYSGSFESDQANEP